MGQMIRLIGLQILILSMLLGLSLSLYPNVIKVRVVKPKKSKTEQQKERQAKEQEQPCEKEYKLCKL